MSQNLLFEKYPNLDRGALMQVFQSEGFSLQRTCNTLQELYGPPRPAKTSRDLPALQPVPDFSRNDLVKV